MQRHVVFPERMEPSETVYIHRNINRKPEFRTQDSRTFYFPEIPIYDFPAGHYAAVYAHFLFRTGYGKALGGGPV